MSQPAACSEHSALVSRARWTKDVTISQGTEKTRGKGKVAVGYSAELRAACGQFDSDSDPTKILTTLRKLGTGWRGGGGCSGAVGYRTERAALASQSQRSACLNLKKAQHEAVTSQQERPS